MTKAERVFVGLGANLGDAVHSVRAALLQLGALPRTVVVAASSLYRSAPLDADGPDYVNAVAELRTELEPDELLVHSCRRWSSASAGSARTAMRRVRWTSICCTSVSAASRRRH